MSDIMSCMPFEQLLKWTISEHDTKGTVFGVHRPYIADPAKAQTIFGRKLETPIGPAAGPNSQLAQNIVASYYAGSRFFELKTVQIMDGAELAACVNKPCIKADDECYNCEWSTELYVPQAQDEYIKAWFLLSFMAKEYGLGSMDGFQFNISVGYDLAGIKSEKINTFIENMKNAENTETFKECKRVLLAHADEFKNVTKEDIENISPRICNSATISTLHGCPPQEIESIANYLLTEKKMNTFIKCNPTLLGYEFARETMNKMGYDYIVFGRFHFDDDLQYKDAVPMLQRLMKLSDDMGLEFGVKITNTFPVDVTRNELPSEEMYMSGKSLYPLSIALAAKLSREFDGKLRIAYSGGADAFNIAGIVGAGVWPVTVATTILKPGGYQRLKQMAEILDAQGVKAFEGIDVAALNKVAEDAVTDKHHIKPAKLPPSRKSNERVPLLDCYIAPCEEACPIHQEITTYVKLAGEGKYEEALKVILNRNALPFITGTICAHGCQGHCTRNFYETPVQIRDTKLTCAQKAYDAVIGTLKPEGSCDKKVAVVGGGPSGMAAAFYLARMGAEVTIYEKREKLGGIVSAVIPDFRIDDTVIAKDVSLLEQLGVKILYGTEAPAVESLRAEYDDVILAVGAYKRGQLELEGKQAVNALEFLENFNKTCGKVALGKNVVVIGGGNTAMDTARAAKRCEGVEHVYLVYRRTKRYMPADEHELQLALADGVEFRELLAPVKMENGQLKCNEMVLGETDASGRASVTATGNVVNVPADTVIAAVGEQVPAEFYQANGINVDERGRALVSDKLETNLEGVYVIGDGLYGPSLVVKGMANAITAAEAITGRMISDSMSKSVSPESVYAKKGILDEPGNKKEADRCLCCSSVCENCVDVCPNRANISIKVPGMTKAQIIHVDYMCNECGNCLVFCPYASAPYLDKFTLFASEEDMANSKNQGFVVLDKEKVSCKVRFLGEEFGWEKGQDSRLPFGLQKVIETVCSDYAYLLG
ncbi:putative selenate reductase subunit YgfK [bacterium]|nr:putative selenate reductase subunit YgfK [bacterium]MDY4502954.1 putative selenate reductase subunit YgfK [Bariatricus sp.]